MKNFRKMDEMEMSIAIKSIKIAWIYNNIFLIIWIWYDWIKFKDFQLFAFILMISQTLIFWICQLFLKWNLGKDEK